MENELKMLMAQAKIELARMEAQSPAQIGPEKIAKLQRSLQNTLNREKVQTAQGVPW